MKRNFKKVSKKIIRSELTLPDNGKVLNLRSLGGYLGRNQIFEVNQTLILKVFHHESEKRAHVEIQALKLLKNKKVPTPKYIKRGVFSGNVPWILMSKLPGEPFMNLSYLAPEHTVQMVEQMAKILAKMHNYSTRIYRPFPEKDKPQAEKMAKLHKLNSPHQNLIERSIAKWITLGEQCKFENTALVHMDFCGRNMLCNPKNNAVITGVIDFERSHLGDPEQDLAFVFFKELMPNMHLCQYFFEVYASHFKKHPLAVEKINFYLIDLLLGICTWAYYDDQEYYQLAIEALEKMELNLVDLKTYFNEQEYA